VQVPGWPRRLHQLTADGDERETNGDERETNGDERETNGTGCFKGHTTEGVERERESERGSAAQGSSISSSKEEKRRAGQGRGRASSPLAAGERLSNCVSRLRRDR
jgi:hypothetical protein